jgi:carbonic anhydrase
VHRAADGSLLVIAVLMQEGASNPFIVRIWRQLPSAAGQINVADAQSINVDQLLPKDGKYFTYTGSLTTPPCTEGVTWVVLAAPVTVSQAQIEQFTGLFPHNARPVEPLNGRTVRFSN